MDNSSKFKVIPHKSEEKAFEIAKRAVKMENYKFTLIQIFVLIWFVGILALSASIEINNLEDFSFTAKTAIYVLSMVLISFSILKDNSSQLALSLKELEEVIKDNKCKYTEKALIAEFLEEINTNRFNGLIFSLKLSDKTITQLKQESKKVYYKNTYGDVDFVRLKKKPKKLFKTIYDNKSKENCILNCNTMTMVVSL